MTQTSDNDEQCENNLETQTEHQRRKSKEKKHVSFPPDEEIVSGFAEHRNTERKADSCLTLTEVIVAYQESCSRHQVQPRTYILQQLQGAVCVGGNVESLDLKGERLDQRSCEALEVVLKSLHFDFISLHAAQLEENGASSLLDMILYYESTAHLDISDNSSMGTLGWRALAHLIKQPCLVFSVNGVIFAVRANSPSSANNSRVAFSQKPKPRSRCTSSSLKDDSVALTRLDVCNMALLDYPAQALSKALLTSRLSVLHLNNAKLSGRPLYTLVGALKTNRALKELCLANNSLNSYQDALQLGDLLRYNQTLQTLELSNNALADPGLEELCDGLRCQTSFLKVLLLRNNQITAKGMDHLAKALPVLKILQMLDLGENLLGNEGMQILREPLMVNCSVLQLGLSQTNITCEGTVALAEFLAESRQIQKLDLRQNLVKIGGLMALSLALRINCSLTCLELDYIAPQEQKQDEFLKETQMRLQMEITQRCLTNARCFNSATQASET